MSQVIPYIRDQSKLLWQPRFRIKFSSYDEDYDWGTFDFITPREVREYLAKWLTKGSLLELMREYGEHTFILVTPGESFRWRVQMLNTFQIGNVWPDEVKNPIPQCPSCMEYHSEVEFVERITYRHWHTLGDRANGNQFDREWEIVAVKCGGCGHEFDEWSDVFQILMYDYRQKYHFVGEHLVK